MTDRKIIGCLIEATAPRRPKRRGVVLPPARRSRNGALRLAVDGKKPAPFNPDEWTIRIIAGPTYGYGELPAEHLATKTMLKTELRMRPADERKDGIAWYKVRKGEVELYPVADAVLMPDLPPARADAWWKARTCQRCGESRPRPLVEYSDGARRCSACQKIAAEERWTEQARAAQAESAAWAREVLADPRTLLLTKAYDWSRPRVRIETLTGPPTGIVIADVRLRDIEDLDEWHDRYHRDYTPEQTEAWRKKYEGTVPKSEFHPIAASIHESRIIAWSGNDAYLQLASMPHVKAGDEIDSRLALWSGEAPHRSGYWYPEPRLPWQYYPQHFNAHAVQRELRKTDGNLEAEIGGLRYLLRVMAHCQAPEPTVGPVVIAR